MSIGMTSRILNFTFDGTYWLRVTQACSDYPPGHHVAREISQFCTAQLVGAEKSRSRADRRFPRVADLEGNNPA